MRYHLGRMPVPESRCLRPHQLGALLVDDLALGRSRRRRTRAGSCAGRSCRLPPCAGALDLAREHLLSITSPSFMPRVSQRLCVGVAEDPHQCLRARGRSGSSRVALAARASAPAVVDAPRLVALGADDVQAARRHHVLVALLQSASTAARPAPSAGSSSRSALRLPPSTMSGAAAGHVRRRWSRRRRRPACATMCASRSCCLRSAPRARCRALEDPRQQFGRLDRVVPTSTGCWRFTQSSCLDDRLVLVLLRQVDRVRRIVADHPDCASGSPRPRARRSAGTRKASVSAVPVMPASLPYLRK